MALNNKYFSSDSFCGSGIQEQLSSVVLAQDSNKLRSQGRMVLRSPKLWLGLQGPLPSSVTWLFEGGFSLSPGGPLYRAAHKVASPRARSEEQERETNMEATGSYNLIWKVTYHYFCHFLLVRVELLSTTHTQQRRLSKDGAPHLRAWLPPHPSLKLFLQTVLQIQYPHIIKGNQR